MKPKLTLYYDKECPFCNRYADYLSLQKLYGLELRNARISLDEINLQCPRLDINEGMILVAEGECIQGGQALAYLDGLLERSSWFSRLHSVWALPQWVTRPLYTLIKKLRKVLLWLMNKKSDIV